MKCIFKCFRSASTSIHLVDRCLILIMFMLLIQSSFCLFFKPHLTAETNNIDNIIRTATASIFGYFLSSNFISHVPRQGKTSYSPKPLETGSGTDSPLTGKTGYQIGFSSPPSPEEQQTGSLSVTEETEDGRDASTASHLQIKIATIIAVFCLFILTVIRNTSYDSQPLSISTIATISQFRDLVSGCVGFLIGVPTARLKS